MSQAVAVNITAETTRRVQTAGVDVTRRGCLAAAAASAAALSAPGASASATAPLVGGADAALLDLAAEFRAIQTRLDELAVLYPFTLSEPPPEVAAEAAAAVDRRHVLRVAIGGVRARTVRGIRAKAAVQAMLLPDDPADSDEYLLLSLCRDLLDGDVV
jgi:hypothetical protein